MAKGAAIRFISYEETVPKLLDLLKLHNEIKKYDKIVLKPSLSDIKEDSTSKEFVEAVLRFCIANKNPVTEVFIAEGADGSDTTDLFDKHGYRSLAEKYDVTLADLNEADTETIRNEDFLRFSEIEYPKLLSESFIISLPKLAENSETDISGALSNMLGAFPSDYYSGFFSEGKNKIRKWPIKYSIHDIIKCKSPEFTIMDASNQGYVLAGLPLEIDKQSAKLLGKAWSDVPYIKLMDDHFIELEHNNS
jgi:uncharacterized protein (DUF362 family)